MKSFKEYFENWVEPDEAMGYLGCLLGFINYEGDAYEYVKKTKISPLHSNNQVSTMLFEMLEQMVKVGFLEKDDNWAYRWNKSFKGFWEGGKGGY